jgi:uncharacterized protein (DUF2236 family)
MQLMHPAIGQSVIDHSDFMRDPYGRIYRSIPQIWAMLLTPDGARRGRHIRDLHRDIRGTDAQGRTYHALDPDTFWWAHATFTWDIFRSVELFHATPLDARERAVLYEDTVEWYALYGLSMRPVPATLDAFEARFDAICRRDLEMTPAVMHALATGEREGLRTPMVPLPIARALVPFARAPSRILAYGCLPRMIREKIGVVWTTNDRRAFLALKLAMRSGFGVMPHAVNRLTLSLSLRRTGRVTRAERYSPAA